MTAAASSLHGPSGSGAPLNLKQVAARLGVHYMTAYRYVRQGELAGARSGTQWTVTPEALADFVGRGRAGTAGEPGADWAGRLERCLVAGDETAAWRVLGGALAAGHDPVACYLDVLSVALASIGERFGAGELVGAERHVSVAVAARLVARLGARFRRPGRSRGAVVFGAPSGELHTLPIAIAADVIRLAGFEVVELGADVPAAVFAEAAGRTPRLVAVGLGVTSEERLSEVLAVLEALAELPEPPPVLLGGLAAASPAARRLEGVHAVSGDAREAVAQIEQLAARRRRPGSRAAPLTDPCPPASRGAPEVAGDR
ncbi:MAG: putative corrinoid protein [Acidimicrobiaceae bacterium]|nr:putative corrinoid protein [Acidimicrobiaceae bacterium]